MPAIDRATRRGIKDRRGSGSGSPLAGVPAALRSPGQPIAPAARTSMEARFGHDFSRVRVHNDPVAAASAAALGARAYAVGSHLVFAEGAYALETPAGRDLLAHELGHVVEDRETTIRLRLAPADLAERAHYATEEERSRILEILNPQQAAGAPPVSDPDGFRGAITVAVNHRIDALKVSAAEAKPSLTKPQVLSLSDVAEREVRAFYGVEITAAAARGGPSVGGTSGAGTLSSHVGLVSEMTDVEATVCQWVTSRMALETKILEDFHVLVDEGRAKLHCSGGPPPGTGGRDQALFESVRDEIVSSRHADLVTVIPAVGSFTLRTPGEEPKIFIQPRLSAPGLMEDPERSGRWRILGTLLHEMLHFLEHPSFRQAMEGVEETDIGVEGFAEQFARPVYERLVKRAATDHALRAAIEGVDAPFDPEIVPERTGYAGYVEKVSALAAIIGEEALRAAYFLGRVELLGLGSWTGAEAARRFSLRFPANTIGVGLLLTHTGQGFFRVDYGRVVLGRAGKAQLHLGGTIDYLMEGQRLGVGADAVLQYSWPNVYLRGGVMVGGSVSLGRPQTSSLRLDVVPGFEAGVRIAAFRLGAGLNVLVPVGGPVPERTVRAAGLIGISADF